MKRIDYITEQIALWTSVHHDSEGSVKAVARGQLLDILAENASLTAGQGQEWVE